MANLTNLESRGYKICLTGLTGLIFCYGPGEGWREGRNV